MHSQRAADCPYWASAVSHIDVEEQHLACFQLNVLRQTLIELIFSHNVMEHHLWAIILNVPAELLWQMRPWNAAKTPVLNHAVEHGDPHARRSEWLYRPICRVSVPGRRRALESTLIEYGCTPQYDVRSDELLDRVQDVRMPGNLQPL